MLRRVKLRAICRRRYSESQKRRLIQTVGMLCREKGRPVSSGDLRQHFEQHPEKRPDLMKRIGQQLIAASERKKGLSPFLRCVGVHSNFAFYASDDDPEWRVAFIDFCAEENAKNLARRQIPEACLLLAGNGAVRQAMHSASGYRAEFELLSRGHRNPDRIRNLLGASLENIDCLEAIHFRPSETDLIGRAEALRMISDAITLRRPHDLAFSSNRHLSFWRWPQCSLFPAPKVYSASATQLEHVISGSWPIDAEDGSMHMAWARALRYGQPVPL